MREILHAFLLSVFFPVFTMNTFSVFTQRIIAVLTLCFYCIYIQFIFCFTTKYVFCIYTLIVHFLYLYFYTQYISVFLLSVNMNDNCTYPI